MRTPAPLLFGVLVGFGPAAAAAPATEPGVEAELRRSTQELMDALAPGRVEVWDRLLDPAMIQMDENGVVRDRKAALAEVRPLPPGLVGSIAVDRFQVVQHGDTAVVANEVQESLDYHGQALHTRFRSLDTWRRTPRGWRLLAQHIAAVLKDPPSVALDRTELCGYAGLYELTPDIRTTIRCGDGDLVSERADRPASSYRAEVRDVFFAPGQPRVRRIFTRDADGRVDGFVDRREGEDVRWRRIREAEGR